MNLLEELKNQEKKFDLLTSELDSFKYEYNDEQQVINGEAWRKLYDESISASRKIKQLKTILDNIEENINLLELTEEEKQEILNSLEKTAEEIDNLDNEILMIEQNKADNKNSVAIYNIILTDIIKMIESSKSVNLTKNSDNYKLELMDNSSNEEYFKLPCEEQCNFNEILDSIDKLCSHFNGSTYVVNEAGKKYEFSKQELNKFKIMLKKYITLKLIKDKKITQADLFRVFGKQRAEEILKEMNVLNDINVSQGDYIEKNELIASLQSFIKEREPYWLNVLNKNKKEQTLNEIAKTNYK